VYKNEDMSSLYEYQARIIEADLKKTGLWLGTGSTKTRIALELAQGSVLVIAPKTQKEDANWERENEKWNINKNVTTISKETFRRDWQKLPRFDTLIVDEAHTCLGVTPNIRWVKKQARPKTSQLFEALDEYIKKTQPARLYLATATIIRSPMTVWGASQILGRDWDFYKFRNTFYIRLPMPGREVFTPKTDNETKEKLADLVRKLGYVGRLEDYFDVPEQNYKTINIDLTPKQKARIKEMSLEFPEPIVRVGKIHQIENGVLAGDEFNEAEVFENNKIQTLLDLAIEFPRMVIFARYTAQIAQIASAMEKAGKKVLCLTGATKERGEVLKEANESLECVFIAQSQISSGWQLGKTKEHPEYYDYNCMVFASMDYSVINRIQGEGRILRADNIKKNLYINLVVRGGVDEAVDKCVSMKQDFNEKLYVNI